MALSYANILTRVLQWLQDTGAAIFASAETEYGIENELKHLSRYSPQIIDIIYKIESRTGTDVTGTASSLTDLVKLQFVAGDATDEKVIHNTTDHTWAVVLANSSTSVNTLSADIMDANEKYAIYNKRCRNKKQIYIGDMPSYLYIESVEYPIGTPRNYAMVSNDVIELEVYDSTIKDSDSTLTNLNQTEVLVKYAIPHVVCQLTDLAGAVHTAGTADATSMQVKDFTDAEVVEVGDVFTIANHRTTYIVTAALTLADQASTGKTLYFHPGLEAATVGEDIITFNKSSLTPEEENYLIRLVAGRACISKSTSYYTQIKSAGDALDAANTAIGDVAALIELATKASTGDIALARTSIDKSIKATTGSVVLANAQFDKLNVDASAPIDLATTSLSSGLSLVNTIPIGGGAAEYMGQAASNIGVAQGYLISGQAYLQEASVYHTNAAQDLNAASADLRSAGEKTNEAIVNLRLVASQLQVAQSGLRYEEFGRRELALVENELRAHAGYPTSRRYPRE